MIVYDDYLKLVLQVTPKLSAFSIKGEPVL